METPMPDDQLAHPPPRTSDPLRGPFDLFRIATGTVRRGEYLVIGILLLLVKYALDVGVSAIHEVAFNPLMYLSLRISPLTTSHDARYLLALSCVALPFVWVGVSLSVRRLRDAGFSAFWAGLFFLPFVHFVFFAALALVPSAAPKPLDAPDQGPFRASSGPPIAGPPPPRLLAVLVPRSQPLAYVLAIFLSLVMGLVGYVVVEQVNRSFGTVFFVGLPFGVGLFVAFLTSYHQHATTMRRAIMNGIWTHVCMMLLLCAVAFEGVACIVMSFPLVAMMSALGGMIGFSLALSARGGVVATLVLLALPGLVGFDLAHPQAIDRRSVVSEVVIHAPVETVWKNVVSFPPIDEAPDAIFALVAMPIEARIEGEGAGAVRRCIFTNGVFQAFEEPIEVWRPPYELTFNVRAQPSSLDDYIDVTRGQFRLRDNGDGTTTLFGETWYGMKLHPATYFGAWGQMLLHHIHLRVLRHIKRISEDPGAMARGRATTGTPNALPLVLPPWMASSHATCRCTQTSDSR